MHSSARWRCCFLWVEEHTDQAGTWIFYLFLKLLEGSGAAMHAHTGINKQWNLLCFSLVSTHSGMHTHLKENPDKSLPWEHKHMKWFTFLWKMLLNESTCTQVSQRLQICSWALTQQSISLTQKLFSLKAAPTSPLHGNKHVTGIHEKDGFI